MEIGIPTEILFTTIGGLMVYAFLSEKSSNKEKFSDIDKKFANLEKAIVTNSKSLNKEEKKELEQFIQNEMKLFLVSDNFSNRMEKIVKDAVIHCNKNDEISKNHIYDLMTEAKSILERMEKLK